MEKKVNICANQRQSPVPVHTLLHGYSYTEKSQRAGWVGAEHTKWLKGNLKKLRLFFLDLDFFCWLIVQIQNVIVMFVRR